MKAFTPIFLIALSVGVYYAYISPTFAEVQTLMAQKAQYGDVLQKAKDITTKRDQVLASYNAISPDDIASLKKVVPEQFDSVAFVSHVNTIASRYGMIVKGMQITQQQTDQSQQVVSVSQNQYKTIGVSFSIKGQYSQFVSFLKDLESSFSLVDVREISIKSDTGASGASIFDYNINLNTYSLY